MSSTKIPFLIFIFALANLGIWNAIANFPTLHPFVSFLNIGQGDGVLVANARSAMLYDTGPSGFTTTQEIAKLLPFYRKTIDVIMLSHSDKDHYGGTFELLKRYRVGALVINPYVSQESGWQQLLALAKSKNIPIVALDENDTIQTPYENVRIIHPKSNDASLKNDNERSLVVYLVQKENTKKTSFLFTGDIGKTTEQKLIRQYHIVTDYLLVPHHGSKYSSSAEFLKALGNVHAVIQVGKNSYGHPTNETLQRFAKDKIPVWRTDTQGTLIIK